MSFSMYGRCDVSMPLQFHSRCPERIEARIRTRPRDPTLNLWPNAREGKSERRPSAKPSLPSTSGQQHENQSGLKAPLGESALGGARSA